MERTLSSSAYSLDYRYRQQQLRVEDQLQKKRVVKQKKMEARRKKFFFTMNLFLVLSMCMLILFGYAQITKASRESSNLKKEYEDLVAKNRKLSVDIQAMRDTKVIEDIAINQLGMVKPEKNQTVYLDLGKTDHVNMAGETGEEIPKSGLAAVISDGFHSILSYFN